jgi:hypothetical protein
VAGLVLAAVPAVASAREPTAAAPSRIRIAQRAQADLVRRSIEGAARRLAQGPCSLIFSDFQDSAGRSLSARLEALGTTGPEYVGWVYFQDGAHMSKCAREAVLAVATPGSRVIHICPRFAELRRRHRGYAETVIIHETLHTLGLGEDPPSTHEITSRVRQRCGV